MQKRQVLWWLLLFQLFCNTLVTFNINIAIVSMTNTNSYADESNKTSNIVCPNTTIFLRDFYNNPNLTDEVSPQKIEFNWSEPEQNMVLSGYYWLNCFSILPGGILAHKFGSKRVVGYAQTISSVMSSLIPILAQYGPVVVSWIRAVQGLLSFMSVPAGIYTIMGKWSPPQERGKFGTIFLIGSSVAFTVGSLGFGYIGQYIHWKYIFHSTSICGIIWSTFWFTLIYDSPHQHPTISTAEKEYIENSLKKSSVITKLSVPWKRIITSVPVIICILATSSGLWSFVMLNTYTPIYLSTVYGLSSNEIGIIISVPKFLAAIAALFFGYYSDLTIKKGLLSITNIRKISGFLGGVIGAIPLIVIANSTCKINVILICIFLSNFIAVCGNFGAPLAVMDMSPTFCGVLEGFLGTFASIQTFVLCSLVNYLTDILGIEELWRSVFLFTALYLIAMTIVFLIFGTSEVQNWNYEDIKLVSKEKKPLHSNSKENCLETIT